MQLLIGVLFLIQLCLFGAGLWFWLHWQQRIKQQDLKLAESLDDLDLVEFQENVSNLLDALKKTGADILRQTDERQAGLSKLNEKAKELEKRTALRLEQVDKQLRRLDALYDALEAKTPAKPIKEAKPEVEKSDKPSKAKNAPAKAPKAVSIGSLAKDESLEIAASDSAKAIEPHALIGAAAQVAEKASPVQDEASLKPISRYGHVHGLAKQGLSVEQIAKQTHLLPGEVELILRLKRR
jgi:histidinol phosphatase-like enzyme